MPFALIGAIVWTMIEYYFHRIILHIDVLKVNKLGGHLLHHSFPNLNNKVALSVLGTSAEIAVTAIVLFYLFDALPISMFFIGFIGTLVNYDSIHYYCHFGPQIDIGWLKTLRIHHLKHHYRDQATNFGVTNIFWDWVFGTEENKLKPK
jgi:sterol desaturase/sphingolipid hydroxylase (fatty acid hydroxylase superfamily)